MAMRPGIVPLVEGTLIELRGVNTNPEAQSEDTTRMMYLLTVVAAIFPPLTLLTEPMGTDFRDIAAREQSLAFDVLVIGLIILGTVLALFFWQSRRRFL